MVLRRTSVLEVATGVEKHRYLFGRVWAASLSLVEVSEAGFCRSALIMQYTSHQIRPHQQALALN